MEFSMEFSDVSRNKLGKYRVTHYVLYLRLVPSAVHMYVGKSLMH